MQLLRQILPQLFIFLVVLFQLAACRDGNDVLSQEKFYEAFNKEGLEWYKDKILFFTGSKTRSLISNFLDGYEAKINAECEADTTRPRRPIVLRDVLEHFGLKDQIPGQNGEDDTAEYKDLFWERSSRALASVAAGTVYVLVPSDEKEWGTFYLGIEQDILIKSARVQNIIEILVDGPNAGDIRKVVKGQKEFDRIDIVMATEEQKKLGQEEAKAANAALDKEAAALANKKAAMMKRLAARRAGNTAEGSTSKEPGEQ